MKISELIAHLQQHLAEHGDCSVVVAWEMTIHSLDQSDISFGEWDGGSGVIIDAD